MIKLNDGKRTLSFSGALLGKSSSFTKDSLRWIEFELYKTQAGQYILWRSGKSKVLHTIWCNKKLDSIPSNAIQLDNFSLCKKCHPSSVETYLSPELPRNKVINTKSANSVVKSLYMTDENDVKYLTKVATDLLEQASGVDEGICKAYKEEYID